jgi:hypothetical protein
MKPCAVKLNYQITRPDTLLHEIQQAGFDKIFSVAENGSQIFINEIFYLKPA